MREEGFLVPPVISRDQTATRLGSIMARQFPVSRSSLTARWAARSPGTPSAAAAALFVKTPRAGDLAALARKTQTMGLALPFSLSRTHRTPPPSLSHTTPTITPPKQKKGPQPGRPLRPHVGHPGVPLLEGQQGARSGLGRGHPVRLPAQPEEVHPGHQGERRCFDEAAAAARSDESEGNDCAPD